MNIETIKHIIIYFLVFVLIIGLTSVFIVKDFIGQAREIELQGKDMLNMQLVLNDGGLSKEEKDIIMKPTIKDKDRKVYKKGDTGGVVKGFQEMLFILDFLRSNLDGNFGPMTEEAIKKFQAVENIEQTGKLDIETQKALEKAFKSKESLENLQSTENQQSQTPDTQNNLIVY